MNIILKNIKRIGLICAMLLSSHLGAQTRNKIENPLRDRFYQKVETPSISTNNEAIQWLNKTLNTSTENWKIEKETIDKLGYRHLHLQQLFDGKIIVGAEIKLHFNSDGLYLANGFNNPIKKLNNKLRLNKEEAIVKSLEANPSRQYAWECQDNYPSIEPELVIVPSFDGKRIYSLAYKVDVYSVKPLFRFTSYIDASTGKELLKHSRIHHSDANGTAHTMYRGIQSFITDSIGESSYELRNTVGGGIHTVNMLTNTYQSSDIEFDNSTNIWNSTANNDHAAYDAHWGATETYNYFYNTHSRQSYDDDDAEIKCRVHYDDDYVNAFWDGSQLTFGDGDSDNGTTPLTTLAIIGHEFTHGVVENSAGLVYSYQSGALNESFADIFGVCLDFDVDSSQADWLMGNEIYTNGSFFRSMSNPNLASDPDTYLGTHWHTSSADNGGVHTNSGVQNFWFYLLAEGGSGTNDIDDIYSISGIGRLKASKIAYRSLNNYLSSNSNYADARTYSIQAATDLYGSCSNEVIATTNAWYAVGVGALFNNSVSSIFIADNNTNCQLPFTVNFTSNSTNTTTYLWNFGDGDTSALANPSHTYTTQGDFNVQLISTGTATCGNGIDTLLLENYIQIDTLNVPLAASCDISVTSTSSSYSIDNFNFGSITNASGLTTSSIEDFTCTYSTDITAGIPMPIYVSTGYSSPNLAVYIDYNNSGNFDSTELLASNTYGYINENIILSHPNIVYNTPLRMRAIYTTNPITGSCQSTYYGQQEDYTITILVNSNPPVSNFTIDQATVNVGANIQYLDNSLNVPTSWSWSFPGGTPSTSSVQNPIIQYNNVGSYNVELITSNSYGADTLLMTNYITVSNTYTMCTDDLSTSLNGILYDSGGPTGNYSNGENCTFLIGSDCVDSIFINLNMLDLENCCDKLTIYKGSEAIYSNQIFYGSSASNQEFVIDQPYALIKFTSDYSVIDPGFHLDWTCVSLDTLTPVSDFVFTDTIPLNFPWEFSSASSEDVSFYQWSLNNIFVSSDSTTDIIFTNPGLNTVSLISSNCAYSDTIEYTVYVQDLPQLSISTDTIFATVDCGGTAQFDSLFQITNTSTGDTYIEQFQQVTNDSLNILALTLGVDFTPEFNNMQNILNQNYPNHTLTTLSSTSASDFDAVIGNIDLVIFPEVEYSSVDYSNLVSSLDNFVNNGGNVLFSGRDNYYINSMNSTGLIDASNSSYSSGVLTIEMPNDNLMDSIITPLYALTATYNVNINTDGFTDVITILSKSILSYKQYGAGMIYYLGLDYSYYNDNTARLLTNILSECTSDVIISSDSSSYFLSGYDSTFISIDIDATSLYTGEYIYSISFTANDSIGNYEIPVVLTVEGNAELTVDTTCIEFDPIFANLMDSKILVLENNTCTDLSISNMYVSNADVFTLSNDTLFLAPYSTDSITIYFESDTLSIYNELITIITQNDSISICLEGETTPPPNIEVNPISFPTQSVSCYDELEYEFTVYNTGLTDLNFEMDYDGSAAINIVSFSYGVYNADLSNFQTTLSNLGIAYNLYNFAGNNSDSVDHYLSLSDLVIIPPIGYSSNFFDYNNLMDKVEDFVNDGGHLITLGTTRYEMYNSSLFTGYYSSNSGYSNYGLTRVANSYLLEGTTSPLNSSYQTYYHNFTNSNCQEILYQNTISNQAVSEWTYGDGVVTYIGFTYNFSTDNNKTILKNAIKQYHTISDYTFQPDTGIVIPGDSITVTLTVNVSNFPTGTNNETVLFLSNDPDSSVLAIDFSIIKDITPCPDFESYSQFVGLGDTVTFIDLSSNAPTNWNWELEDGFPASSIFQNPTISFHSTGLKDITLEVGNSQGSYPITKEDFIHVDHLYTMCDNNQSNTPTGILFDSGGEHDFYQNYQNCSFLINPLCADSILINIENISLAINSNLLIYDGTNSFGNLLYSSNSTTQNDLEFVASSGAAYVTFTSSYNTDAGFTLLWDAYIPIGNSGISSFTVDNINPAFGDSINFTSTSTIDNFMWQWSFGDGIWSTEENPKYSYNQPGIYDVMLIAHNCYAADTSYSTITVQDYPLLVFSPDSTYLNIECNSVDSFLFIISDSIGGELNYELELEPSLIQDSSVQHLSYSGEDFTFWFYDIPTDLDSLRLEIRMNGDYSSTSENITVYIDNVNYTTLYGGYDGVEIVNNIILSGTMLQNYLADGTLKIDLYNSPYVYVSSSFENSNTVLIEYRNHSSEFISTDNSLLSNSLSTGQSDSIWLYIDAHNFVPGMYETNVQLTTNDSIGNYDIPVVVNITGISQLEMDSSTCLDFGNVLVGNTVTESFYIANTGCLDISINNINSTNTNIAWLGNPSTILPGDSLEIDMSYYTLAGEAITGNISIQTNTGTVTKCITGSANLGPIASFSAGVLSENIDCNSPAVNQQTFTIDNVGDQDLSLEFSGFSQTANGVFVSPNTLTIIQPGQSADFTLSVTSSLITSSNLNTEIVFESNMTIDFEIPLIIENDNPELSPSFNFYISNISQVYFSNTTSGNFSTSWNFGDGNNSTEQHSTHTYMANGSYTVTLTLTDDCGDSYSISHVVTIQGVSLDEIDNKGSLFPNPSNGMIYINYLTKIDRIQIYSIEGKLIHSVNYSIPSFAVELDLKHISKGNYLIHIESLGEKGIAKIILK